jgi:hypothetical protein
MLLEPDAVHPVQFFDGRSALRPEKRLLLAMLRDAVRTVQRLPARGRLTRSQKTAWRWIYSDDVTWPFSFLNVCGVIAIDPAYVRGELARRAFARLDDEEPTRTAVAPADRSASSAWTDDSPTSDRPSSAATRASSSWTRFFGAAGHLQKRGSRIVGVEE